MTHRKVKKVDTRTRILEVSARLFAEKGYKETSTRDIAAALSIASPSLYYHFKSKGSILTELLKEPQLFVQKEIEKALTYSGQLRTRKIVEGLLGALEFHNGIVIVASDNVADVSESFKTDNRNELNVVSILSQVIQTENKELKITMAISAVEGVVKQLLKTSENSLDFTNQLSKKRDAIIAVVMNILYSIQYE